MVVPANLNPVPVSGMELYWRNLVGTNVSFSRFLSVLTFFQSRSFCLTLFSLFFCLSVFKFCIHAVFMFHIEYLASCTAMRSHTALLRLEGGTHHQKTLALTQNWWAQPSLTQFLLMRCRISLRRYASCPYKRSRPRPSMGGSRSARIGLGAALKRQMRYWFRSPC